MQKKEALDRQANTGSGLLPAWIASRYLLARGSALSYVSRLALLGLVLSVAVLVVVLSVVNGFERELRERVLAVLPQISATSFNGLSEEDVAALLDAELPPEITGLAPFVSGTVLFAANDKIAGATLTGIDPGRYDAVSDMPTYTTRGNLEGLNLERYGVILGGRLAEQLDLGAGDTVLLVLPVGAVTPAGAVPRQRRFHVVDVFDSQSQIDSQSAFVSLSTAQRLFRTGTRVHGVQGRLADLFDSSAARDFLYERLGADEVRVRTWMSTFGPLYQAIAVQKLTMFLLLSFLVAVAAFNLVSGLLMIVEQRRNDVAILRTLGSETGGVMMLFLLMGLVLAGFGIGLGLLVGAGVAASLPLIYATLSNAGDLNLMSQYIISYLPVDVRLADLLQIAGGALLLSVGASIYPAWRATRLLPSRVLAHE